MTTSESVKKAVWKGFSVTGISKLLGISRPTFYKRLEDNSWTNDEVTILKNQKVIV